MAAKEIDYINEITSTDEARILIVYGRRRMGKTELIEQRFRQRNLVKFEGLENQPAPVQRKHFLEQFAKYAHNSELAKTQCDSWKQVFELLAEYCQTGQWTLFFEGQ